MPSVLCTDLLFELSHSMYNWLHSESGNVTVVHCIVRTHSLTLVFTQHTVFSLSLFLSQCVSPLSISQSASDGSMSAGGQRPDWCRRVLLPFVLWYFFLACPVVRDWIIVCHLEGLAGAES